MIKKYPTQPIILHTIYEIFVIVKKTCKSLEVDEVNIEHKKKLTT